jgi:hypothetical protein
MQTSRPGTLRVWLSRLGPYCIAALALAWVFHTTDIQKLREALHRADLGLFVLFSAAILVANCAADTFAMHRVFSWFGCHVRYRELFVIRASTYLLAVINYHVGQAAIVGYLYRARRVPLLRATGWILFIIGVNVGTLFLLASGGAWKSTGNLSFLRIIPIATLAGATAWAILLTIKPKVLAERRVLQPLFEMGVLGHLRGVLVRLPHVGVLMVWHIVSLRMFGVKVPVLDALLYLPIYFATSSLPINVNGLGAAQLVAIAFFAPYAGDMATGRAAVIAYSLGTSLVSIFLQLGLGLVCLGPATKLGLPREAPEEIEVEAARAVAEDAHAHKEENDDNDAAAEV